MWHILKLYGVFLTFFIGFISLTTGKMLPLSSKSNGNENKFEYNFLVIYKYLNF